MNLRNWIVMPPCLIGLGLSIVGCSSPASWGMSKHRLSSPQLSASDMTKRSGRLEPAEMTARSGRSNSRETTLESYHRLAIQADREQRYQEAESYYKRALAMSPTDATIWNDLGYSYLLQGRLQEAELSLGRAVALNPKDRRARNNLGLVLGHQGRAEEALNEFRVAGGEAEAQRNLAMVSRSRGRSVPDSPASQPLVRPDSPYAIAQASLDYPMPSPPPSANPIPTQDRKDGIRWVPYEEPQQPLGVPSSPNPSLPNQPANGTPAWTPNVTSSAPSVGSVLGRRTLSSTHTNNPAVEAVAGPAPTTRSSQGSN